MKFSIKRDRGQCNDPRPAGESWTTERLAHWVAETRALTERISTIKHLPRLKIRALLQTMARQLDDPGDVLGISIRIYTLGDFGVEVNSERLDFSRHAPRKPLELLMTLIAHGGRSVSRVQLCDDLWPDTDGDIALLSFDVTLHRLRKLLGVPGAITCWNGRVNLNPEICWVDAWAFEQTVSAFDRDHLAGGTPDPAAAVDFEQLLDLYRGAFLNQHDEAWALSKREKLRAKFIRVVRAHAERCERSGQTEHAVRIYERAFEVDPGVVEFHSRPVTSNPAGVDL